MVHSDEDGESPTPPKVREGLIVMIAGSSGLHNAEWAPLGADKSDPYCVCQVQCKSGLYTFRTRAVENSLNPVWNHLELVADYEHGFSLVFTVFDKDTLSEDDSLGSVQLQCESFHPWGFTGRLPLVSAVDKSQTQNAYIYVVVMDAPLCSGDLRVLKGGIELWRYFVLVENALLYFTDSEELQWGHRERGRIMLQDVEGVKLDRDNHLIVSLSGSDYDIKLLTAGWQDARRWALACERALLLGGVDERRPKDLTKYLLPLCEGLLTLEEQEKKEAPELYFVLFSDELLGYGDFAAYRDCLDPRCRESLKGAPAVTLDTAGIIKLAMPKKDLRLRTPNWESAQLWGPAFKRALASQGAESRVSWEQFAKMPVMEGTLSIIKGSTVVSRYFVLYVDRMDYFKDEDEFRGTVEKHGTIGMNQMLRVIQFNDAIITITLTNQKCFQLQECEAGQAEHWGEAFNKVLRVRGNGTVIKHMEGWDHELWEEKLDEAKKAMEEKRKAKD